MKTQTAVQYYATMADNINYKHFLKIITTTEYYKELTDVLNKALEMEKEQIKKLLEIIIWYDEESDVRPNAEIYNWFKQYYNETYKSE